MQVCNNYFELYCWHGEHAKIVSMIRKYHNHKLQTNPWHHEEEQRFSNCSNMKNYYEIVLSLSQFVNYI